MYRLCILPFKVNVAVYVVVEHYLRQYHADTSTLKQRQDKKECYFYF